MFIALVLLREPSKWKVLGLWLGIDRVCSSRLQYLYFPCFPLLPTHTISNGGATSNDKNTVTHYGTSSLSSLSRSTSVLVHRGTCTCTNWTCCTDRSKWKAWTAPAGRKLPGWMTLHSFRAGCCRPAGTYTSLLYAYGSQQSHACAIYVHLWQKVNFLRISTCCRSGPVHSIKTIPTTPRAYAVGRPVRDETAS